MGISVEMEVHLAACNDVRLYGAVRSSVHRLNRAIVGEAGGPGTCRVLVVGTFLLTEEPLVHVSDAPGRGRRNSPANAAGKAPAMLCDLP
jgi:hypothetical protein